MIFLGIWGKRYLLFDMEFWFPFRTLFIIYVYTICTSSNLFGYKYCTHWMRFTTNICACLLRWYYWVCCICFVESCFRLSIWVWFTFWRWLLWCSVIIELLLMVSLYRETKVPLFNFFSYFSFWKHLLLFNIYQAVRALKM